MKNFRFNDNILELRPPWSSGQDVALSRLSQGFDSPWGYHCRPTDGFLFRLGISPCDAIDAKRNNRISKPFYGVATKQPQLLLSYKHHVKYSVASLLTIPLGGTTAVLRTAFFVLNFCFGIYGKHNMTICLIWLDRKKSDSLFSSPLILSDNIQSYLIGFSAEIFVTFKIKSYGILSFFVRRFAQ